MEKIFSFKSIAIVYMVKHFSTTFVIDNGIKRWQTITLPNNIKENIETSK